MTLKKLFLLLISLLLIGFIAVAHANGTIPSVWHVEIQAKDVISAAKQICLMYRGHGYWEKADIQTMGIYVLSQKEEAFQTTLCLYTTHAVFDVSSGTPMLLAGDLVPVHVVLSCVDNKYILDSYQQPEDGSTNYSSMQAIFGNELAYDIAKNQDAYGNLAYQDALDEANHYLSKESGTWIKFLNTGSNPLAAMIVRRSLSGWYPSFEGKTILSSYKRMYTLAVENEKSYSGTLTFQSFDIAGEQLSYVKLHVVGNEIIVLEGEMPPLYE